MLKQSLKNLVFAPLAIAGCASLQPADMSKAVTQCDAGARSIEVRDRGVVVRVLGMRDSLSGLHEGFFVSVKSAGQPHDYRFEHNADITGPVPLRVGEPIEFQGQFECDDLVVHWTHHDPRGRHRAGFLTVDGRTYQ